MKVLFALIVTMVTVWASASSAQERQLETRRESCTTSGFCFGYGYNFSNSKYEYFYGYQTSCQGHRDDTYQDGYLINTGTCEAQ